MPLFNPSFIRLPGLLFAVQGDAASSSSSEANKFLAQAMQDSLAEIETCELALEKTSNDDIKAFSQHMIDQHSRMGREIEQLASRKQAELPKDISEEQRSTYEELSRLSGTEFDRKFIDHNVEDHEKDIRIFKEQAQQLSDKDLKEFAEKGARQLDEHLRMAREVGRKLHS